MTKTLQGGIGTIFAAFLTFPVFAQPDFPYRWPDYSVVPIFFSPTDWRVNSKEVKHEAAALKRALKDVQNFYGDQLGGKSFLLNPLKVVQGRHAKEAYGITWNGGNIYTDGIEVADTFAGTVLKELRDRGFPTAPLQNKDGYVALIFVKGAGGWAGGLEFPEKDGGWALLGDFAIDSIEGDVRGGDYWWSGRKKQIRATAHELGHTFGLPHPDAYGSEMSSSIMGYWWTPGIGFNQHDIDQLNADKSHWFTSSVTTSCLQAQSTGLTQLTGLTQSIPEPASVVSMLAGMLIALIRLGLPVRLRAIFTEYFRKQHKGFSAAVANRPS